MLPVYLCHFPAGCSINQLIHYGMLAVRDYFGPMLNSINQTPLPEFPLDKITATITIHYSKTDTHTPLPNIEKLNSKLKCSSMHVIGTPFNHLDYMVGINAYKAVYCKIIEFISQPPKCTN